MISCVLIAALPHIPGATAQSTIPQSYPEFLDVTLPESNTTYSFTPQANNSTITKTFQITEFRDVTFADVLVEQSGQHVASVTISVKLNGVNATKSHTENSLVDLEPLFFILDDQAMILPKEQNVLSFSISVTFNEPNAWDLNKDQSYSLIFRSITIKSAYRQSVNADVSTFNQSNSHFTALLIDPTYNIATPGTITGDKNTLLSLFSYDLNFYIVLPKEMKSNYFINLTFSYSSAIDIKSIFIENFGLVSSFQTDTGISYVFRYISNKDSGSLSKGTFSFTPKQSGFYTFHLNGFFFITDNYKLFPGGPEMDLFLFVNATIIIPLVVLSKLIYRRLFY